MKKKCPIFCKFVILATVLSLVFFVIGIICKERIVFVDKSYGFDVNNDVSLFEYDYEFTSNETTWLQENNGSTLSIGVNEKDRYLLDCDDFDNECHGFVTRYGDYFENRHAMNVQYQRISSNDEINQDIVISNKKSIEGYNMLNELTKIPYEFYTLQSNHYTYQIASDFIGETVGVISGEDADLFFSSFENYNVTIIRYDSIEELCDALLNHEVELITHYDLGSFYRSSFSNDDIMYACTLNDITANISVFVKEEKQQLCSIVSTLTSKMKSIGSFEGIIYNVKYDLLKRDMNLDQDDKTDVTLRVGIDYNNIPYFYNDFNEFNGIYKLYFITFSNITGVNIEYINSTDPISDLRSNNVDLILDYKDYNYKRIEYFNIDLYMLSNNHCEEIVLGYSDLNGMNIGVIEDYSSLVDRYFVEELQVYDDVIKAELALQSGLLDYLIVSKETYSYYMNNKNMFTVNSKIPNAAVNYIYVSDDVDDSLFSMLNQYNDYVYDRMFYSEGVLDINGYSTLSYTHFFVISLMLLGVSLLLLIYNFLRYRYIITLENRTLMKSNNMKSEFLSTFSHEVRTPLNAIIGYTNILNFIIPNDEENKEIRDKLKTIEYSSNLLLNLLNDTLDLSKAESGFMVLEKKPFNLYRVCEEVVMLVRPSAKEKENKIELDCHNIFNEIELIGDAFRLRQVFLNLLGNANKFTEKGVITLVVSEDCDDFMSAMYSNLPKEKLKDNEIYVNIKIEDTGIGMTKKQIDKIFSPFVQADPSVTRKYGGTGLGLAISNKIIKMMGSDIEVKSFPNVGSTFYMRLKFEVNR